MPKELSRNEAIKVYVEHLREERRDRLRGDAEGDALGILIDIALELGRSYGLRRGTEWAERIVLREDTPPAQQVLIHYFAANAWSALGRLAKREVTRTDWEQPELEREIGHLRHAKSQAALLSKDRYCQVLTNLGNSLIATGRIIEAISEWDEALEIRPNFCMALGNRGSGLWRYARAAFDPFHQRILARGALYSLNEALQGDDPSCYPSARSAFHTIRSNVERSFPPKPQGKHVLKNSRKWSREEVAYREWAATERLFLNPLNDVRTDQIAMADVLTLPTMVTGFNEGPTFLGLFNQLKQEYVAARWLMYDASDGFFVHFADRDVTLVNTLDYPAYGIRVEQMKLAFRSAYSLFDKISFFINDYFRLQIPERRVFFKTLWYEKQDRQRSLRSELVNRNNAFLLALFWLSKDFFHESPASIPDTEPHAKVLADMRHELEHKYLKVHDRSSIRRGRVSDADDSRDRLAYSVVREEFDRDTLALMRRVRAALLYLALSIRVEEDRRASKRGPNTISFPMVTDRWNDEWKT
jgi:hypothetical protein